VAVAVHLKKMGTDDHLRKAFAFFDQDKSFYIEREDLWTALGDELDDNGEKVIDAIIQDVDTDKVCHSIPSLFCMKGTNETTAKLPGMSPKSEVYLYATLPSNNRTKRIFADNPH